MAYRYKIESILYNRLHAVLETRLNVLADQGWRVIDIKWLDGHDDCVVTFERESQQQTNSKASADGAAEG